MNELKVAKSIVATAVAAGLIGSLGLTGSAGAAPKLCEDGTRPPCNGGGGGGKPDNPGGGKPSGNKGDVYADLVVVLRDTAGLPVLKEVDTAEGSVSCLQPISAAPIPPDDDPDTTDPVTVTNDADGKEVSPIPLGGTGVEGEECDVDPDYAAYVQEVLFGRLNLGRSPTRVLSQQLRDVTGVLGSSVEPVQIDEAGRFVAYVPIATEIDSPGTNLARGLSLRVRGHNMW